jgi:polysaccharide biosynthesis/export protein
MKHINNPFGRILGVWAIGAIGVCLAADPPANPPSTAAVPAALYRLNLGDVIEVRLFYNPEMNESVQIRPDGRISLPLVGEVEVAGKTIPEASGMISALYAKEVFTPKVTIQVRSYAAQKVYIGGEVPRTGIIPLPGTMTVFEAISEAGGVKNTGNKHLAILIRKNSGGLPEGRRLKLYEHGVLTADASTPLAPFDVILVPESKISRVDRWVDQSIRQMIPVTMTSGFNYLISRQLGGGGTTVPIF